MKLGSLFAGIGGFDLGLGWAGIETAWQVEKDEWCRKVLTKHWPDVPKYGDIHEFNNEAERGAVEPVDIIAGGFPCQPFSQAGQRKGQGDDRYLWPEMVKTISLLRPSWVIGENVAGIVNMALDQVLSDLEGEGYTCQSFIIPACAINAPHRRDRVWIVGNRTVERLHAGTHARIYSEKKGSRTWDEESKRRNSNAPNTPHQRLQGRKRSGSHGQEQKVAHGSTPERNHAWDEPWIEAATRLCRMDDGLPRGVDRTNRLKAMGNAVVPQIPYIIGKYIMETTWT